MASNLFYFSCFVYLCLGLPILVQTNESARPLGNSEKNPENGYRSNSLWTKIKTVEQSVLDKAKGIPALSDLVPSNNSEFGRFIGVALKTVGKAIGVINAMQAFGNETTAEPMLEDLTQPKLSGFRNETSKHPTNQSEIDNYEEVIYANSNGSKIWHEQNYITGIYSSNVSNGTYKIIQSSNGTESSIARIEIVQETEGDRNQSSIVVSYDSENENWIEDNRPTLRNFPKEYLQDQMTLGPSSKGSGISEMYKMAHKSQIEENINATSVAPLSNVTMELDVHGQSFKILMHKINPHAFLPGAYVSVITEDIVEARKYFDIATMEDLMTYEGTVDNDNGSYVSGSIVDGVFRGFAMLSNGTVIYTKSATLNKNSENLVVDHGTDAEHRHCNDSKHLNKKCHDSSSLEPHFCKREGKRKILCFKGKEKKSNVFLTSFGKESIKLFRAKTVSNASCAVRLVSDPSYYLEAHNKSVLNVVRELLVIFLHANHILRHVDLNGNGKPENLHLRLASITIYASEKDHNQWKGNSVMIRKWEKLSMQPQDGCMKLMFLSKRLFGEPDSIAKEGGVCMGNQRKGEAAHNVAIINTENYSGRSLSATCWTTMMVIGQIMGSYKTDCASDPDPSLFNDWRRFFSECRSINIANTLTYRGFCLEKNETEYRQMKPKQIRRGRCGDGIVEGSEECDCGNIVECSMKKHCCVPPGRLNECQLNRSKGNKCDSVHRCCTSDCQIVPESSMQFCGAGEPVCSSSNAYCDGKSPHCPVKDDVAKSFNDRPCGVGGTGVCVDGFCNTLCYRSGLLDCQCNASSSSECHMCCRKRAKGSPCVSAEDLGMKSSGPKLLYRDSKPCGENQQGRCDEFGVCFLKSDGATKHQNMGNLRFKMFEFIFIAFAIFWRSIVVQVIL